MGILGLMTVAFIIALFLIGIFFNNKKYQEINIFPKNLSFSESCIMNRKTAKIIDAVGIFSGRLSVL